jgi:hypothetical protein
MKNGLENVVECWLWLWANHAYQYAWVQLEPIFICWRSDEHRYKDAQFDS